MKSLYLNCEEVKIEFILSFFYHINVQMRFKQRFHFSQCSSIQINQSWFSSRDEIIKFRNLWTKMIKVSKKMQKIVNIFSKISLQKYYRHCFSKRDLSFPFYIICTKKNVSSISLSLSMVSNATKSLFYAF